MHEDDTETEEQIWERKLRARKKVEEDNNTKPHTDATTTDTMSSDQEAIIFQTEVLVTRTIPEPTNEDDGPLKTMRLQQDQDNVLRKYKLRLLKEPYNQQLLARDPSAASTTTTQEKSNSYRSCYLSIDRLIHSSAPWTIKQTLRNSQNDTTMPGEVDSHG